MTISRSVVCDRNSNFLNGITTINYYDLLSISFPNADHHSFLDTDNSYFEIDANIKIAFVKKRKYQYLNRYRFY